MALYAWKTDRAPKPEAAAAGCPKTGWVHGGGRPWRVIAFPTAEGAREHAPADAVVAEYTGTEDVVMWDELLTPPARSTAKADADRLHYRDETGWLRCPDEYREKYREAGQTGPVYAIKCPHLFDPLRFVTSAGRS